MQPQMILMRNLLGLAALLLVFAYSHASDQAVTESHDVKSNVTPFTDANYTSKHATVVTTAVLNKAREQLPKGDFLDGSNMSDHSKEQLIADLPEGVGPVDFSEFDFVLAEQPETVHPSLHAAVRKAFVDRGLFKIAEGIYQVRGDIAHITFVRGETGWIVLDAGVSREFAAGAWELLKEHASITDDDAISAVVYSHSHADHFGGVKGLVTQAQVDTGDVEVIAPYGFMQEVISESIIAGNAMMRRGIYHFGVALDINDEGTGAVPVMTTGGGATTLIAPTIELPKGQGEITNRVVDGIEIDFMDISSAEAPAATILYLPRWKLLFNSELVTRKLHNIYTLRGAKTRDALAWSKLINRIIYVWGDKLEHITGPHGPTFSGRDKITEFLRLQRDNYAFLHNQSMKLANSGMKLQDIGETVAESVPASLRSVWHTHGYHGTYSHNARGVVNHYLGFYDGNPANLNPLKIKPEAVKYVEYMGGADTIMARAKDDYKVGEYRFVATVLNKLVTAQPGYWPARHLLADSYEQLGYQSEGPQWRNAYLTAAKELRTSKVLQWQSLGDSTDLLRAASTENMLDALAIKLNADKVAGKEIKLLLSLSDMNETWLLELSNSVLSYIELDNVRDVDIELRVKRHQFAKLMNGFLSTKEFMKQEGVNVKGSYSQLYVLVDAIEADDRDFPIVPLVQ